MYEIVGYRLVDMNTTEGGKVRGYSCFILNKLPQAGLEGVEAIKVFFSSDKFPDFKPVLKQTYDLRFNQKGTLIGWAVIDK